MFKLEEITKKFITEEPAEINLLGGYNQATVHYDSLGEPTSIKLLRFLEDEDVDAIRSYLEEEPAKIKRIIDYIESRMNKSSRR